MPLRTCEGVAVTPQRNSLNLTYCCHLLQERRHLKAARKETVRKLPVKLCYITGRVFAIALNGLMVLDFFFNVTEWRLYNCFVTVREKAVTFTEKEKPQAGVTFLSYCVYRTETSFAGYCAMHDPGECFLLY